jgi:pilin isopeptide linkage protein/LPXTG-motif cell wall-anchored protein
LRSVHDEKKIINIAVSILLVFSLLLTTRVSADALSTKQSEVIYLDNGCYITIELNIIENRASTIKRGNKAYIYRNGSGDDGIFNFGSFSFDEEGTYVYTIKEVINAEDEEILYDESEYTVTVVVTLEGAELKATVSVEKDGDAHEGDIRFDNYTTPEIPDNPPPLNPPKTGDSSVLFALIGLITLIGAAFTFKKRREF